MVEVKLMGFFQPLAACLMVTLSLSTAGCRAGRNHGTDAPASPTQSHVSDPVEVAHQRGRQWAQINHANLVTDCGALSDDDERFGCADYVENQSH